jgi:hypothetical protein
MTCAGKFPVIEALLNAGSDRINRDGSIRVLKIQRPLILQKGMADSLCLKARQLDQFGHPVSLCLGLCFCSFWNSKNQISQLSARTKL